MAVGQRRGGIDCGGNRDPAGDFIGGSVNHGDARLVLIMCEDVFAVGGNRDALNDFGDRNDRDQCALFQIEDADTAGVDVRSVGALAVRREDEHMRFDCAGRDFTDNLPGVDVNDVNGLR